MLDEEELKQERKFLDALIGTQFDRSIVLMGRNSLEGGIGYIQMQLHFAADFLLGEESDDLRWAAWPWKSPQRTFS